MQPVVWEQLLSSVYFAVETPKGLQARPDRRQQVSCTLLQCIAFQNKPVWISCLCLSVCCRWLYSISLSLPATVCLCCACLSGRCPAIYSKFLSAISRCLFSSVYFADSELTRSAGSCTVLYTLVELWKVLGKTGVRSAFSFTRFVAFVLRKGFYYCFIVSNVSRVHYVKRVENLFVFLLAVYSVMIS